MQYQPGIPLRLRRELMNRHGVTPEEGALWEAVHDEYLHGLDYGSPAQYLDQYLAWCLDTGRTATPSRYRRWILNGERMSRERELRDERERRRETEEQKRMTPEERARARWNQEWCEG